MKMYVVYTRVSTEDQGRSGLGLAAQERDIGLFLDNFSDTPFEVLGRFSDVMSGANDDRHALDEALRLCRSTGAELLVAKLDRLSRKVAFVAALMDDPKLKIRVAQMPLADKFQLHIYAALAEQERTFISERTKAALRAAKDRGVKLGGLRDKTGARNLAIAENADAFAQKVLPLVRPLLEAGKNLTQIAAAMNSVGIKSSRGGRWTAKAVTRVLDRCA